MISLVVVPVLFSLGLSVTAKQLVQCAHPKVAVPVLTGAALSAALCSGAALGVCGLLAIAQLGPLPHLGHWSAVALRRQSAFPDYLGLAATGVIAGCLLMAAARILRSWRELHRLTQAARGLVPTSGRLVVVDDADATAYALPGAGGRVVVSTAMLHGLSGSERRVVLAHELAHLQGRHYVYRHLARLAAAANPLLRPVVAAVDLGIERWADETAVRSTGDRRAAARALARAAVLTGATRRSGVLAMNGRDVVTRVDALSRPPARLNIGVVAVLAAAVGCCWVATSGVAIWGNDVVQHAETAWAPSQPPAVASHLQ